MVDLDNDGFPDLFLVTGSVYPEVERTLPAYPFRTPRLVFRNLGDGRFEELIDEAGSGVAATHTSRGCAFGDFDNDGDMDIAGREHERAAVAAAQRRLGRRPLAEGAPDRRRNRIAARLARASSPATAAGTQAQEVTAQSSFYSAGTIAVSTLDWAPWPAAELSGPLADRRD